MLYAFVLIGKRNFNITYGYLRKHSDYDNLKTVDFSMGIENM